LGWRATDPTLRIKAIDDKFTGMQADLDRERKAERARLF